MSLLDRLVTAGLPFVPKPLVRHFSRPYIAGEGLEDMIRVVRDLNTQGLLATIDILGEFSQEREQADAAVYQYEEVLATITREKLEANVSVKLTQLGLKIDRELCYQNVRRLVENAAGRSNFVRIDMEDSSCTTDTLDIFLRLHEKHENVGPVIQAYLRRSIDDVRRLAAVEANVRLCKGIYVEPRAVAYQDRDIVNANFGLLLEKLLEGGCYVGIATHDEKLIWEAFRQIDARRLSQDRYEFQMLLGVEESLRRIIQNEGHRLRVYVPFGRHWYAYSLRRLRENPRVAGYVARDVLRRKGR